ncbi:MAG: hypothetical protein JJU11_18415 [Candidatus Sumerlaeia bacterium]|nr:hypothetical protein [Candidatus Sumerlaeia bacterium]
MKQNSKLSAMRRKFLPASAIVALALTAGMAQATVSFVSSTGETGTTPTETDNDFTRLQDAINNLTPGQTLQLTGTFDLTAGHALDSFTAASSLISVDGKTDNTITAAPGSGIVGPYGWYTYGLYVTNSTNTTITGIEIGGFTANIALVGGNGQTLEGTTVSNNTINVRHPGVLGGAATNWQAAGVWAHPIHSSANMTNITVENNQFNLIMHEGLVERINLVANESWFLNIEAMYYHFANPDNGKWDNHLISGNTYEIVTEGPLVDPADIDDFVTLAGVFRGWRDNASATSSDMTITGNTFNGSLELQGETVNAMIALWPNSRSGEFQDPDPGSRIRYTNNTFQNVATAARNWVGSSTDANFDTRVYVFLGNTFIDSGIPSLNVPVIRNVGSGLYGDASPQGFRFDLDTVVEVDGVSMTGIEMLHYVGDPDNQFFAAIDTGSGYAPYGVTTAEVTPEADPSEIVNNPDWTGLPKFSDPTGGGTLAMGYNAFGDEIDPGDPNRFVGLSDDEVYELTEDEAFPPGTRIRAGQTLTIRSENGAKADRYVISPTTSNFATPLFVLDDSTATLILEDVILDGEQASIGAVAGNGGTIETDNVDIKNFVEIALGATGGTTITATNTKITDTNTALRLQGGSSSLTFTDGEIDGVNRVVLFNGNGSLTFTRNNVGSVSGFTFSFGGGGSFPGNAVIGGSQSDGNMFMSPVRVFASPTGSQTGDVASFWNMSHNWHRNIYGPDANNDGYIDGDANIDIGTQTLVDGLRYYLTHGGSGLDIVETNVVATFDRDNDGLPDVVEFRLGTDFRAVSSGPNDVPDGVMVAAGLDPLSSDIPAGWDGDSFSADTNSSGYVDWYEALMADLGMTASLGDLTNNGNVELGDAVRALQIVNGALPIYVIPNPNNLNVAGSNPYSLANPLQILRFQAGVRSAFPALPGID